MFSSGCGKSSSSGESADKFRIDCTIKKMTFEEVIMTYFTTNAFTITVDGKMYVYPRDARKMPKEAFNLFNKRLSFEIKKGEDLSEIAKKLSSSLGCDVIYDQGVFKLKL